MIEDLSLNLVSKFEVNRTSGTRPKPTKTLKNPKIDWHFFFELRPEIWYESQFEHADSESEIRLAISLLGSE